MMDAESRTNTRAFTLIELLVVIAILAILAAILFPCFAQAKATSKPATELSNVKQITLAAIMYSNDYDDTYPDACLNEAYTGSHPIGQSTSSQVQNQWLLPDKLWPYARGASKGASIFVSPAMPYWTPVPDFNIPIGKDEKTGETQYKYLSSGGYDYVCGHDADPSKITNKSNPLYAIAELCGSDSDREDPESLFPCGRSFASIESPTSLGLVFRDNFSSLQRPEPSWEQDFLPAALGGRLSEGGTGSSPIGYCDGHAKSITASFKSMMLNFGIHVTECRI